MASSGPGNVPDVVEPTSGDCCVPNSSDGDVHMGDGVRGEHDIATSAAGGDVVDSNDEHTSRVVDDALQLPGTLDIKGSCESVKISSSSDVSINEGRTTMGIFIVMALLQCFVNYDMGALTVMLPWIQEPYQLSTTDLGTMGSLPYIGLIFMTPFIGIIFTLFQARWIILLGLILNILSLSLFALAYNKAMFFIARFLIGATQSFFIVYAPVWIACFAPKVRKNLWMALMQGSIVGGFMFGYLCTALISIADNTYWRTSIFTQMAALLILVYVFMRMPKEFINLPCSNEAHSGEVSGYCGTVVPLSPQTSLECRVPLKSASSNDSSRSAARYTTNCVFNSCAKCSSRSFDNQETQDSMRGRVVSYDISSLGPSENRSLRGHHSTMSHINYYTTQKMDMLRIPSVKQSLNSLEWMRTYHFATTKLSDLAEEPEEKMGLWQSFFTIIRDPYFCFSTLVISTIFYILSGIQFWTTKIAVSVYRMSHTLIYTLFIATSITAPFVGVIGGSWIIDLIGVKYPGKPVIVHWVILSWTVVALLAGISAMVWRNFYNLVGCIWLILFFGGGMLPPLTLITISNVSERLKPMASSVCMCVYHILGYVAGTALPGVVIDLTGDESTAIYATYLPAILGTVGAAANVIACYRISASSEESTSEDNAV
uniref:Transporter, major facilitator family n=3 Tax=Babesia bovis TaxID=5865 RepID=A7AMX2_BABBO|eukprot:XP_001611474.1 transporter, major facilitator family [Babesia bovis T2Bo]